MPDFTLSGRILLKENYDMLSTLDWDFDNAYFLYRRMDFDRCIIFTTYCANNVSPRRICTIIEDCSTFFEECNHRHWAALSFFNKRRSDPDGDRSSRRIPVVLDRDSNCGGDDVSESALHIFD